MPRRHSLSHAEIAALARERGTRVNSAYVSLACFPLPSASRARAACVVSKKVSSSAAVRNRIKRRCRAVLAPHMKDAGPVALVCTAKRAAVGATFAELRADIERALNKVLG